MKTHTPAALAARFAVAGLAWAAGLYAINASPARARDLGQDELQFIEHVNQGRNKEVARHYAHPDCNTYAVNKLFDLAKAGYRADELALAEVHVPGRPATETHVVVEVIGTIKGERAVVVLDSLHAWTETQATLQGLGYVWIVTVGGPRS